METICETLTLHKFFACHKWSHHKECAEGQLELSGFFLLGGQCETTSGGLHQLGKALPSSSRRLFLPSLSIISMRAFRTVRCYCSCSMCNYKLLRKITKLAPSNTVMFFFLFLQEWTFCENVLTVSSSDVFNHCAHCQGQEWCGFTSPHRTRHQVFTQAKGQGLFECT